MRTIRQQLNAHQERFVHHPFFAELKRVSGPEVLRAFTPALSFWVMCFQDVLRLNEARVRDARMRRIALHHKSEDRGHERWFLEDLARLGADVPGVADLFGQAHTTTRDASYALMSEVFRANDDRLRVVLLFALEASGHIFFEHVSQAVSRTGTEGLKYFSDFHLKVEKAHAVFEEGMEDEFWAQPSTEDQLAEAKALVDRTFVAFHAMFDGLLDTLRSTGPAPARVMVA
jgi:hypothetical protein